MNMDEIKKGMTVYVPESATLAGDTEGVSISDTAAVVEMVDDWDDTALVRGTEGFTEGMIQWVDVSSLEELSEHDADAGL